MKKAVFINQSPQSVRRVFADRQMERLHGLADIGEACVSAEELASGVAAEAEVAFSTWGMPALEEETIRRCLPSLRALFYAAGSVQSFARPFLSRGVRVFSGWQANGRAVAQFTAAQIMLALKGYFRVQPILREQGRKAAQAALGGYPGAYDVRVGLLGCGAIGSQVARILRDTDCEVWAYDPFLPAVRAEELGVRLTSMEDIFRECLVISNHLANLPATRGIIRREHFMSMQSCATFINTGRGAQLDEKDLLDALTADSTRTALLDVLTDEGQTDSNPLTRLPNCFVTPHIAGASGREVRRMADYMLDAFEVWEAGGQPNCEVTEKMLETMA